MTTPTLTSPPLLATDRCDRCGARAAVRVTLMNGELYFCGHHAREYMPRLKAQALEVFEDPAYQEANASGK